MENPNIKDSSQPSREVIMKNKIICGEALSELKKLPDECVDMVITSPPYYGLRDYGVKGQLGLEKTFEEYLNKILAITQELKRVLKKEGTLWWNHGDSYGGVQGRGEGKGNEHGQMIPQTTPTNTRNKAAGGVPKQDNTKCLLMQPYRLAQRMIDEQQWILRNIIIWHKPNCMPSSVKDRFTVDYEPILFFSKSKKYYFERQFEEYVPNSDMAYRKKLRCGRKYGVKRPYKDNQPLSHSKTPAIVNPQGRNKRSVWQIPTQPFPDAHFAVYPEALISTPIKAGCPKEICKKCGKAREKIFEYKGGTIGKGWHDHKEDKEKGMLQSHSAFNLKENEDGERYQVIDKGYTKCKCKAGFQPGIVLDPFMGAGTTALVAKKLGRDYLGIELSEEYIKIAKQRLRQKVLI